MHAAVHTTDANFMGRRAHDRAMLLVSQVHRFVGLVEVPLPKDPSWGKSRRRVCLGNGRKRTDEARMNDPLVRNVAEHEEYGKVVHVRVFEQNHHARTQKSQKQKKNNRGEKGNLKGRKTCRLRIRLNGNLCNIKGDLEGTRAPEQLLVWAIMHLLLGHFQDTGAENNGI